MAVIRLGKVQWEIMRVLWKYGGATARQITDEISGKTPISHSTVQTLLRKLAAKGAVTHDVQGRVFVFKPLVAEPEVTTSAARDLLNRVFHGSVSGLVAHLLAHERISDEERADLRKLLQEALRDE